MRPLRRRPLAVLLVAGALVAPAACSSPEPAPDAAARTVDADERIATIMSLRSDVGPAAAQLGSAAVTLVEQTGGLATDGPLAPEERREVAAAIRAGALTLLRDAVDAVEPELAGDATGPDAERVRTALADAARAGGGLVGAAERELVVVERAADAEDDLAVMVEAWTAAGSRNEQLELLAEVANGADDLAAELDAFEDVPGCARRLERRAAAARTVAAGSRELRALVEQRRGEEFDARREELLQDPYGTGAPLVEADHADADCWWSEGPVARQGEAVAAALAELEAALNPADLAASRDG